MPNHETNNVVIVGEPDKIRAFVAEALRVIEPDDNKVIGDRPERVIDFSLIISEPENIEHGNCSGDHPDGIICWLPWRRKNWGTKWGAYSHSVYQLRFLKKWGEEQPYGRVDLRFETAWNQPTPIFQAIERRWGVTVHAVTQDEGGFPDVVYGDPIEGEYLSRTVTYDFDAWDTDVTEEVA